MDMQYFFLNCTGSFYLLCLILKSHCVIKINVYSFISPPSCTSFHKEKSLTAAQIPPYPDCSRFALQIYFCVIQANSTNTLKGVSTLTHIPTLLHSFKSLLVFGGNAFFNLRSQYFPVARKVHFLVFFCYG